MTQREKDEWFHLWLDLRQRLFKACRESKDGWARARDGNVWARPDGMTFNFGVTIRWDDTQLSGMQRAHSWDWTPNIPISPLEKLAECAE